MCVCVCVLGAVKRCVLSFENEYRKLDWHIFSSRHSSSFLWSFLASSCYLDSKRQLGQASERAIWHSRARRAEPSRVEKLNIFKQDSRMPVINWLIFFSSKSSNFMQNWRMSGRPIPKMTELMRRRQSEPMVADDWSMGGWIDGWHDPLEKFISLAQLWRRTGCDKKRRRSLFYSSALEYKLSPHKHATS